MQQLSLFENNQCQKSQRGNIKFIANPFGENVYISTLEIPSGKFIIKYSLLDNKIETFEILDCIGYTGLSLSIIKNIKCLTSTILKSIKK